MAEQDFSFTGTPGGTFSIDGSGGLGSSGTVKLNGVQLQTTEWSTTHIAGSLPANAVHGKVTVNLDDKTIRHGEFK